MLKTREDMMEKIRITCRNICEMSYLKRSDISKIGWCYVFKLTEIISNSSFNKRICKLLTGNATSVNKASRMWKARR